jgi:hypothetical protein
MRPWQVWSRYVRRSPSSTARLRFRPTTQCRKEFAQRNAQCASDSADVDQRWVALTPLDAPDVCVVKSCPVGQFLLREPSFLSQFAHAPPEQGSHVLHSANREGS